MSMTLLEKATLIHGEATGIGDYYRDGLGVHQPAVRLKELALLVEKLAGLVEALAAKEGLTPLQSRIIDETSVMRINVFDDPGVGKRTTPAPNALAAKEER